jgi:16S rRNA U516 pseudouridylate synthase RsuA-like enzyme
MQVESKITEAAEAAASAAAHAVEATKAAEAATRARVAKQEKAKTAKAASTAKTAKAKAAKAATRAKALSEPTVAEMDTRVLEVRLTVDELRQIERLAAEQGLEVSALVRSLLRKSLARNKSTGRKPGR